MADSENLDPQLQIPELLSPPKSPPLQPLNLKRKQPPPRKKDKIARRRKLYRASHQPLTSSQQQQQQQLVTLQNIDDEPTANSVVALATLPPSKMARKITSLRNKLVCESDRRVAVESKYSDKKLECKAAEQQLRQEKRASNTLINIEKEKAAEVLVAARALEEASEETVESAMERMAELTIECNRKVREERQHWLTKRTKLLEKQANERSGYDAIICKRRLHYLPCLPCNVENGTTLEDSPRC